MSKNTVGISFFTRIIFLLVISLILPSFGVAGGRPKVLVVFSYEPDYLWEVEIREELEKALGHRAELTFFYMNTKVDLKNGPTKAAEAYKLFLSLQPDGVISVDDNAQELFVVPYLKNKTKVPVIFCGVNADPNIYGYPAENVTGILERYHFEETLALNRQLAGKTDRFVLMVNRSPLAQLVVNQLEKEKNNLSAELVAVLQPETLPDALEMAKKYRHQADLLVLLTLKGIVDQQGQPVSDAEAISSVAAAFNKPTAATAEFVIRNGVLSGVLASGQEQGEQAALMLSKALRGLPVKDMPVIRNHQGRRMINVTTMKRLGIIPEPMAIRGATLVHSETKPQSLFKTQ